MTSMFTLDDDDNNNNNNNNYYYYYYNYNNSICLDMIKRFSKASGPHKYL